jgi:peptide/nickel transport system substrate-binding protein
LAFDRKAYIDRAYAGSATSLRLPSNPGTWGPSRDVFAAAWKAASEPPHDVDEARRLVQEAGAQGKTITLGTSTGLATVATGTEAWRAAIESIGLKVDLRNVSPENYINFFTDPAARVGVDAVTTTTFGDYADPTSLTATYLLPGGVQNYSNYQNPAIAKLLDLARGEADPTKRAQTAVEVEKAVMVDLPWIPVVAPPTYLVLNTGKTGAPTSFVYMQAPWLARLGAAG